MLILIYSLEIMVYRHLIPQYCLFVCLFVFVQLGRYGRSSGGHWESVVCDALREDPAVHHGARRQAPQQTPDRVLRLPLRVRQDGRGGGECLADVTVQKMIFN